MISSSFVGIFSSDMLIFHTYLLKISRFLVILHSMTLKELNIGQSATVTTVGGSGSLRQHFLDMGLIPGAVVKLKKYAPMGDPMQLTIHGYELTLRLADAEKITVTPVEGSKRPEQGHSRKKEAEHPGLGEVNEAHRRENPVPLPDETQLTFALQGWGHSRTEQYLHNRPARHLFDVSLFQ